MSLPLAGEEGGVAEVVGDLAAEFEAGGQLVLDRAGVQREGQVGLVEQVAALGGVVVAGQVERQHAVAHAGHAAGVDVLVELVVVGVAGAVAQRRAVAEVVLDEWR